MLQTTVVGYLGADAITKNENGKEFTVFRVAHTDRWRDEAGQTHESTQWVDVIMSGRPAVADWLKQGTLVYVCGHARLRAYSSAQARAFVAGITISNPVVELLGGISDSVPGKLYDEQGHQVDVQKYFHVEVASCFLTNGRGKRFAVDDNGWVMPIEEAPAEVQAAGGVAEAEEKPAKKKK